MAIIYHRFDGTDAVGRSWGFGWNSQVADSLAASHTRATTWWTTFWAAIEAMFAENTVAGSNTSYLRSGVSPYNSVQALETNHTMPGTSVLSPLPAQISILCSLRTPLTGRTNRGRFYLPAPSVLTLSTTGEFDASSRDAIVTALGTAWSAVNGPAGETPGVFSKATGLLQPYDEYAVGDKYDTQRRRVKAVVPNRNFQPMPV